LVTPNLSIIIPAYNEAERLERTLDILLEYVRNTSRTEVILIDDGSTDGTAAIAERVLSGEPSALARLIRYSGNRGKGFAVRTGLLEARAPIAAFMDADLSTPLTELPKIVEPIAGGKCDLVFGSRAVDRSLIGIHQPRLRELGGRVFNLAVRVATGLPFWDTQCGFKAFRMSVCRPLVAAGAIDRFGFDVELLYVAYLAGLRLREVPVRWNHCDGSKVSAGRDAVRMLNEIRAIKVRAATGLYNSALLEVGATPIREEAIWRTRWSAGSLRSAYSLLRR
jgi:glycosyltransferase involved in cell wall biosynthesis